MKRVLATAFSAAAALSLVSAPAVATKSPYLGANNSLITINGKVKSVSPHAFTLDYGDGTIVVEMDDRHWNPDGYKLVEGDKVRVTGMIDDDAFETTKIEAGSVYVESLGTHFFANASDEEDANVTVVTPVTVSATVVQGKVTGVKGREFTVDSGKRRLTVDTSSMSYNPLDDEGYQRIEKGDRVIVAGRMNRDFWGMKELNADSVASLGAKKNSQKNASNKNNKATGNGSPSATGKTSGSATK